MISGCLKVSEMMSHADSLHQQFVQLYNANRFADALTIIQQVAQLKPNSASVWSNAASTAQRLSQHELAIEYAQKSLQIDPNYINSYDVLSYNYYLCQDYAQSQKYGLRALQLRHEKILANTPQLPTLPEKKPNANGKKRIAFSLFGHSPKYLEGAVLNAQVAREIFPDWVCRFYVDDSVPVATQQRLQQEGAEVLKVSGEMANWVGTVWRFLALDDPDTAYVIFRDVDSLLSWREAEVVQEWLASGRRFHTIRDGGSHTELILAGLWGAMGGAIPNITEKLRQYFRQPVASKHFADQFFLRDHIWTYVHQDVCAHDRLFGFGDAKPLPELVADVHHIGSCVTNYVVEIPCPFPENTPMQWKLFSCILPVRNRDFSVNRLPEMREICCYETPVQQGKIHFIIPNFYGTGLASGDTKVEIKTQNPFRQPE